MRHFQVNDEHKEIPLTNPGLLHRGDLFYSKVISYIALPVFGLWTLRNLFVDRYLAAAITFGMFIVSVIIHVLNRQVEITDVKIKALWASKNLLLLLFILGLVWVIIIDEKSSRFPWVYLFLWFTFLSMGTGIAAIWNLTLISILTIWFYYYPTGHDIPFTELKYRLLISALILTVASYLREKLMRQYHRELDMKQNELTSSEQKHRRTAERLSAEIEERKTAEKKWEKLNAELDQRVKDRTHHLSEAFQQLREEVEERKQVTENLLQSNAKIEGILESIEDGYYEVDISGNTTAVNPAMCTIAGYTEAELMGSNNRMYMDEENAKAVYSVFNRVFRTGVPARRCRWQIIRKNGETREIETSVSLITNDKITPLGFRGICRDITDDVQVRERLKAAYEQLKITQTQLVQSAKLSSIGELAAGVAHELNQPLTVIRGTTQLAQRRGSKNVMNVDDTIADLSLIEKNTKRMMTIIDHLRKFSRQSESAFEEIDIHDVVEDCFLLIGEQLRVRNIRVERHLAVDLPRIMGDPNKLEQVFLNLLTNARDAIDEKQNDGNTPFKGRIKLSTHFSSGNKPEIDIRIEDSGSGIPEDKKERVFDPFFTTKDVGKGTGLGLSISYGIVKEHQGEIEVLETGSSGTTFRVSLPPA